MNVRAHGGFVKTDRITGAITLAAPAKVNLYLHVVGRRADGYHLLDSLVAFTELADTITARPAGELSLSLDGPFSGAVDASEDNIVIRAARALSAAAGAPARVHFNLTKRLPVAAGLGGGSADAAAALRALMALWNVSGRDVDLPAVAQLLGADVPACLAGHNAFISGIGETITPSPALPRAGLLLVNPGVMLATQSVFGMRRGGFSPVARFDDAPRDAAALAVLLEERTNDLTAPAARLCTVIEDVLATLAAAPGCLLARMSGSGATCFGLFADVIAAETAAGPVRREGWWTAATQIKA